VARDSNDDVFVTGRAMSLDQGTQVLTMKIDGANGDIVWMDRFGGSAGLDDLAWDLAIGPDDQPVITGYLKDDGGQTYQFTRKMANADGSLVWQRLEDGALDNTEVRGAWLALADGGDIVLCYRTFGANGYDVVLKRYAALDGQTMWETLYDGPTHGGDDARAMRPDGQGNLLVAGVQDASWNYDYMALKFDGSDGSLLWSAGYDGPPGWYDVATCVAPGPGGSVVVSGFSDGSGTGWDWATVAFDGQNGSELWVQRYNGPAGQSDEARDIICTDQGEVFVTGYAYSVETNKDLITIRYQVETASPATETPAAMIATKAWPNPFNPRVNLSFDLPRDGFASVEIFDARGRQVAVLQSGDLAAGNHTAVWDGRDSAGRSAAAGTYLVRVQSGDLRSVQKVVLAK
jgi:hypothetical protein